MDKKSLARMSVLKKISKDKSGEMHSPKGEELAKNAKFKKVTVMSDSKEGLEKGLSKAQKILKAKLGEIMDEKPEASEEEMEDCSECSGEGCDYCCGEEEEAEEDSDEE
jgi:hypothetical protein